MSLLTLNDIPIILKSANNLNNNNETTSLNVIIDKEGAEASFGCCWQTNNGWMFTTKFDTEKDFSLPNVFIGGYVIFFIDPLKGLSLNLMTENGAEAFYPARLDSQIDEYRVCMTCKITSANPVLTISTYNRGFNY